MLYSTCLETNLPVKEVIDRHLKRVQETFPNEIIGVFLVGSQNYHLNTPESDVDTRALVLPTFQEIALNKEPVSKELRFEDGGHCAVRDVRLVFREFLKQNPNCLEILCTSYYLLNEKYAGDFYPVLQHANAIAWFNPRAFVKSVHGMICSNEKKLLNMLTPANQSDADASSLVKPLVTIMRMADMLEGYIKGRPFSWCLTPSDCAELLLLKTNPGITAGYVYNSLAQTMSEVSNLLSRADQECPDVIDDRIPTFLDATLINLVSLAVSSDPDYKEAPHE